MVRPVEARRPMAGWQRWDQQPGSRLEPDPVVADAFGFRAAAGRRRRLAAVCR
jgi:hypothetical protein